MFTNFQMLPVEIRLRIWAMASNQEPRIVDIWTDFHRHEQDNITFYAQKYEIILTNKSPPAIIHASQEAREEGLKHYKLEFKTVFPVCTGVSHTFEARFYINYATYTLVPRGYWNINAFADFIQRTWGKLAFLAIDVTGSFWKDNVIDSMTENEWISEGAQEIIFYNAKEMPVPFLDAWEPLRDFKKSYKDVSRDLNFVKTETTGKLLDEAKALLAVYFDKMHGKVVDVDLSKEESVVEGQDETTVVVEDQDEQTADETLDQVYTGHDAEEYVQKTRVRTMELVVGAT